MKNLVKATPTEFMFQTSKMAKAVERWIGAVDIDGIRKEYRARPFKYSDDMTNDEKREEYLRYKEDVRQKSRGMLLTFIKAMFEDHPGETAELLALACFVKPEDVDKHTMSEYLKEITAMIDDESVIDFFTSLGRLGLLDTSKQRQG